MSLALSLARPSKKIVEQINEGTGHICLWRRIASIGKRRGVDSCRTVACSAVAAWRVHDLLQLTEVQPEKLAGAAGVDDHISGSIVRVHVHLRPA